MDYKKMGLSTYILRNFILGGVGGGLIAFSVANFISNNSVIIGLICGLGAGALAMAIGVKNYKQFIIPMKNVIEDLEKLSAKSGIGIRESFSAIFGELASSLKEITFKTEETSKKLLGNARQTSSAAVETVDSINQMSANIQEIAATSQHIAAASDRAAEFAIEGNKGMERVALQMNAIQSASMTSGETIQGLNESAQKISQIVSIINQIAEQTNLLALNAAIEAARAGEHGRGFAVVAEEVRRLAEQSADATKEIYGIVNTIQQETQKTVMSMKDGIDQIDKGTQVVQDVNATFNQIISAVQGLAGDIRSVATSTEEISTLVQKISLAAADQSSAMEDISTTTLNLNEFTAELERITKRFEKI